MKENSVVMIFEYGLNQLTRCFKVFFPQCEIPSPFMNQDSYVKYYSQAFTVAYNVANFSMNFLLGAVHLQKKPSKSP
jgi:hypothetical protein